MREHNMVGHCRGEDFQPTAVFNTDIGKMSTAVSMEFSKAMFSEIWERSYTILSDFTDPSDHGLFQDVTHPEKSPKM